MEGRPGGYCPSLAMADGPFWWPQGLPYPQQPSLPAGTRAPTSESKLPGGSHPFSSPEAIPTLPAQAVPRGTWRHSSRPRPRPSI